MSKYGIILKLSNFGSINLASVSRGRRGTLYILFGMRAARERENNDIYEQRDLCVTIDDVVKVYAF